MPVKRVACAGAVFWLAFGSAGASPDAWAEYNVKTKRDPFVPLLTLEGQRFRPPGLDEEENGSELSHVSLQGIIFDPHAESYAVINGRIVREREEIDGVKILKIEPTTVTILVQGQPHQLILRPPIEETSTQS